VPKLVKTKWRKDRKTIKLYPSTSVIYLLQITTPTTERMFPTTPKAIARPLIFLFAVELLLCDLLPFQIFGGIFFANGDYVFFYSGM
jgi:hypothetical protein